MRKLWGGRFAQETDALIEELNNSLPFDGRMWREDIDGSIAHADMLGNQKIIPREEADQLIAGLRAIREDLEFGAESLPEGAEDIHSAIEGMLTERLGPVAGKLHTARSRNDQVALDIRLHLRAQIDLIDAELMEFLLVLFNLSEAEIDTILPGYTHLQHAQPILLAHHLMAYFWMIERDRERLADLRKRANRSPLGAGAMAGTGFDIDRQATSKALGFDYPLQNSLDAVSDRDHLIEFLSFASILAMHLSRLAEELILWNSHEYRFVTLDDRVTTGSSIMPQKKNPDVAELVRGKTGRIYGNLMTMLTVMKGLPLSYNKDMQEDKEPLFDTVDTLTRTLPAFRLTLSTAKFNRERMRDATRGDFSTATDLADYLVRQGMPFRQAHDIVGEVVRDCTSKGKGLEDLSLEEIESIRPEFKGRGEEIRQALTVEASVASRSSEGGTSKQSVLNQIEKARTVLL